MRSTRLAGGGVRAVVLAVSVIAVAGLASPSSAVSPGAHASAHAYDCVVTAWQTEPSGPTVAGAQLLVGADVRCTQAKSIDIRLTVTDVLGNGNGLGQGTTVAPYRATNGGTTQLQVTGQVPVPRPGHVYAVSAIAELTSGCGRNTCGTYPPAPAPPAAPGVDLSALEASACNNATDTYDESCELDFVVPGA